MRYQITTPCCGYQQLTKSDIGRTVHCTKCTKKFTLAQKHVGWKYHTSGSIKCPFCRHPLTDHNQQMRLTRLDCTLCGCHLLLETLD